MFFDESNEAMGAFVGAAMNDLAALLSELSAYGANSMDESVFFEKYRTSMMTFSRKLLNHTSKLRCDWPNSSSSSNSLEMLHRLLTCDDDSSHGLLSSSRDNDKQIFSRDAATQANLKSVLTGNACVQTTISIPVDNNWSDNDHATSSACSTTVSQQDAMLDVSSPPLSTSPSRSSSNHRTTMKTSISSNRLAGPKRMLRFEQTAALRGVYAKSTFLTSEQRSQLAKELNITPQQIKIWFQNRRFKDKFKARQQADDAHDDYDEDDELLSEEHC